MRIIFSILFVLTSAFGSERVHSPSTDQAVGVVGIVTNCKNGSPINNAFVGLRRYESRINDLTSKDGIYCLFVARRNLKFELTYKADGFWGKVSNSRNTAQNPVKMDKWCLNQQAANNLEQLERIDELVEAEYDIYQASSSAALRKMIKADLNEFHDAIALPNPIPTYMSEEERRLKLGAKAVLENALFKMK